MSWIAVLIAVVAAIGIGAVVFFQLRANAKRLQTFDAQFKPLGFLSMGYELAPGIAVTEPQLRHAVDVAYGFILLDGPWQIATVRDLLRTLRIYVRAEAEWEPAQPTDPPAKTIGGLYDPIAHVVAVDVNLNSLCHEMIEACVYKLTPGRFPHEDWHRYNLDTANASYLNEHAKVVP